MGVIGDRFAFWEPVRLGLKAAVDDLAEEDLAWEPPNGAMSIHKQLRHIITAEEMWVQAALRGGSYTVRSYRVLPTKEAILEDLDRVHQRTLEYLATLDEQGDPEVLRHTVLVPAGPFEGQHLRVGDILYNLIDHECHHRGQIVLIRRLMGKPCERFVNALAFMEGNE
ncbi:DinB family protein [Limnochorda pilosa]|uniref:DinB-like domain-containing protein n=1 Tax=Limnochorda pilosa TaxID=1555112 RepID=A0A0K2SGE2_LIMPI|nr:DinB family protein [Limnochorda pilosa]BAS26166.1 hypothetical protein LIP_0309 [Limnochorda pilosa]